MNLLQNNSIPFVEILLSSRLIDFKFGKKIKFEERVSKSASTILQAIINSNKI